jgi:PAS domain S-box-containing protein
MCGVDERQASRDRELPSDVIDLIAEFDQRVAHLSFQEIASGALAFMGQRMLLTRASVALLNDDHSNFRIFDSTLEIKGAQSGTLIPLNSATLAETVERGQSVYRADLRQSPIENAVDRALAEAGLRATFSTPLVCAGHCIGTLNAASTEVDGITSITRRIIELLAPRLAFAIHVATTHDQLRESEKRFRDVFSTVGDGILVAETETRTLVMANPAIGRMLGRTPEDLVGLSINAIHPKSHLDEIVGTFVAMVEGRIAHALDIRMLRADGSVVFADVAARSTKLSGRPCVVGVFRDASSRRGREHEQVNLQKLESIRTLAAGIAHDFNNLLTGLVGHMSLVQPHLDRDSEAWSSMEEAQRAAARAAGLTRQLLTFAKGGAPVRQVTDLVSIVRDSAGLACAGTNVRCVFRFPERKVTVLGDEGQLAQVVQNLVRNAVEAMPQGGTVSLDITEAAATQTGTVREARIEVSDHGPGIAPEIVDQIFVPFFTTKATGSGLGLAVAYSVVQSHGGRIEVSSRPGSGTTFQVFLPTIEVASAKLPSSSQVRAQARVLIMDDQAIVRQVAERALARSGCSTHSVADGTEAIAAYRRALQDGQPFDVAILDLTVPGGMGGREAALEILAIDPRARLVVSSGYSDDAVMSNFRQHGFVDVLPKPYNAGQLVAMVARITS